MSRQTCPAMPYKLISWGSSGPKDGFLPLHETLSTFSPARTVSLRAGPASQDRQPFDFVDRNHCDGRQGCWLDIPTPVLKTHFFKVRVAGEEELYIKAVLADVKIHGI